MSCTFCPLPWNGINLRNNGDIRICCNANSYGPHKGIVKKEDGTPWNAGRDDWNESRNADLFKEVRKAMLNGEWHEECERCRQEEISGMRSRRMMENEEWVSGYGAHDKNINGSPWEICTPEYAAEHTAEDGTIDTAQFPIHYFDLRYGNFCNLKCRMCGATDSHTWYEDHAKLHGVDAFKDAGDVIELTRNDKGRLSTTHYDWFLQNNRYWDNFEKYTKEALKFYIVGGEPLIIKEHQESLERIIDSGRAKDIIIEYNTNLTNVTPRMLELWSDFKQVRIGASIDGYGDVFEYQRTPAKWDAVYKNLKDIDSRESIQLRGWFAFTVTVFNVFHLPEFMKWKLEESGLERLNPADGMRPVITHHMCHSPRNYNIKVLPDHIKKQVQDSYEEYREYMRNSDHSDKIKKEFIRILDGVEKFMMNESYTETHLDIFTETTLLLDRMRKQNVVDIVPQYRELFE